MSKMETTNFNISEHILQLSKTLNIEGSVGIIGKELELITLVKNLPLLYDKYNIDFKNKRKKEEGWKAIAQIFNVPVGEVRLKWTSMRDRFNKYNTGKPSTPTCPYYDEMKFIEPYIFRRRRCTTKKSLKNVLSDDESNGSVQMNLDATSLNLTNFIEIIQQFPVLYSQNSDDKTLTKLEAWKIISETVGIPVEDCKIRWKNLKARYRKEKFFYLNVKQQNNRWELLDKIAFLDEESEREDEISADENMSTDITVQKREYMPLSDEKCIEFVDTSSNFSSNIDEAIQDYSVNIRPTSVRECVEDDLFGQAIAAELKRIPNGRKKSKLKAEIYRLLYEYSSD